MKIFHLQAQNIAPKITPDISPKINFLVCILFKSIDQLTGNSSMPSSEIGWGSGSRNTENTGKYRSSIVLNTENVQYRNFNTIEY